MSEEQEPDSAIFRDALLRTLLPDPGILTSEEDEAWWETMQRGIPWDIGELTYDNAERLVSRSWAWKRAVDRLFSVVVPGEAARRVHVPQRAEDRAPGGRRRGGRGALPGRLHRGRARHSASGTSQRVEHWMSLR